MRFLLSVCLLLAAGHATAVDLVLHNGRVWTGDHATPSASAIAIEGERIVAIGDDTSMLALAGVQTQRIDLKGRRVVPGINDAHVHLGASAPSTALQLPFPEPTTEQVIAALRAQSKDGDGWITGNLGGAAFADRALDRGRLDTLHPQRPVRLVSWSGHGTILNTAAQRALAVDPAVAVPGGWYGRNATGVFDGRLYEYAQWRNHYLQPALPDEAEIAALRGFSRQAAQFGITSVQVMAMMPPERFIALWQRAAPAQRLRLIRMPLDSAPGAVVAGAASPLAAESAQLRVSGTKWILDGTPIEQGAAVRAPYPGTQAHGRLNFSRAEIEALLREILARDDHALLHIAGDATAATVLDAMQAISPASQWRAKRLRFEHGDGLVANLLPRARAFGVVVVQNPSHFTVASPFLPVPPLLSGFLDAEIPLAIGSDGPLHPWLNMQWAQELPSSPGQGLSREQTLAAYTAGSAYAEFSEADKGKLVAGFYADLAVLSQDVLDAKLPTQALPGTSSLLTLIGGKIAWRDPAF